MHDFSHITSIIGLIIEALGFGALVVSVVLARSEIRKNHDWNRRKASFDLTFQVASGYVQQIRSRLLREYGADITNPDAPKYQALIDSMDDRKKSLFNADIKALMNCFETIALGVKHNILDEDICYEHVSLVLTSAWIWAETLVTSVQKIDPTAWIECSHFAKTWKERQAREIAALRMPGRRPT